MLLLLLLVAGVTNTLAQTVTIRGNNGSMVAALASGYQDYGYKSGGFATWQHEQLSMVLTTADRTALTPNDQLDNPANNLYVDDSGEHIQICKGSGYGYVSLSLPKGYRFTSYTIVFSKPGELTKGPEGNTVEFNESNQPSQFGETGSNFGAYTTSAIVYREGESATITRTEGVGGAMTNVLYFKLGYNNDDFELITLESAEFRFTAEENYSPVAPTTSVSNVSAVDVPFSTSRVDYGKIAATENQWGATRISYISENVHDLNGYFKLYEAESLTNGTGIDGVQGKVVETKSGTISSAGNYFKLGRTGKEQVYFLETPDYVEVSDGTQVPVGYRIVSAKFEAANQVGKRIFYITYDVEGRWGTTTYYLGTNGRFTETYNPTRWEMDTDGYISSNGYYLYWNNNNASTQRTKPVGYGEFEIYNGKIRMRDWPTYYVRCLAQSGWGGTTYYGRISNTDGEDATYTSVDESGMTSTGDFTLKVYTKDGKSEFASETISSENPSATIDLTNLNNDAVKFGVTGIGLVRATLTLQALDPYLNSMDVVCQDEGKHVTITQPFTAADFSVNGGVFHFYLPEDLEGKKVNISFANLSSEYMDETYDGGKEECNSRINFVKSAHYNEFGASNNSLYNNRDEAADAKKDRLSVEWAGTAKFKFNNADEVGTNGGTLAEYPFSLEAYGREGGVFQKIQFTVDETDQNMVRYVFTTDETRYNIAPTTAIQHRAYAFYEMDVHVQSKTYTPNVKFTKVYDKTLYRDNDGKVQTGSFYGVEVTAEDADGKAGYSSSATIFKIIDAAVKGTEEAADVTETEKDEETGTETTKKIGSYEGKASDLTSSTQLIYLDFSKLAGVYQITDEEHSDMPAFSATNAANCLIYLPKGSSASNNNVAAMSEDGKTFTAVADVVLTDMQPFYSLYDVQVLPTRQATYQRRLTKDSYGKSQHFSIIMPYQLAVNEGVHTNIDGSTFTVRSMQTSNALKLEDGSTYAYMPSLANVTATVPNMPYFIEVPSEMDESNLVITQNGTLIKATKSIPADTEAGTPAVTYNSSNYTFTGPSSNGSVAAGTAAGSYEFTPTGTFAGIEVAKTQNIFYFGNNEFVNSADYNYNSKIKVAPFRMYYANGSGTNGAKLASFGLIFGEGIGDDPTGISSLNGNPDLMVVPGNGVITVTSTKEQNVRVNSVSGVLVNNAKLQAGETQTIQVPAGETIQVPAGVYVINGVKIIVK